MRKTPLVIAVIIIALFSFNGSELYKKDIRNRLIIQGIGIDREADGKYSVTLQALNTNVQSSGDSGGENPTKIYKVSGDTVYSAIKSVAEYEGKLPMYSQNRVIIIGRKTAEKGIADVIDFFVRDVENSASVRIAMADGKASEILELSSEKGEITARNIELSIRSAEYEAEIFETELYSLVNRYKDAFGSFGLPIISIKDKRAEVNGTAVFRGDKLTDTISRDETVMLNFICNSFENGDIVYKTDNDENVALSINHSKTRRKLSMENGTPIFNIHVDVKCDVAEISGGTTKTVDEKRLNELENDAKKYLETEILKTTEKLYYDMGTDVAGLSRLIYIFQPSFYREHEKNLNTVMAQSRYNVEVQVTVRRVGHEFVDIK